MTFFSKFFKNKNINVDKEILNIALKNDYKLSPSILVLNSNFTLKQAKSHLKRMHEFGFYVLKHTDDNKVFYYFSNLNLKKK